MSDPTSNDVAPANDNASRRPEWKYGLGLISAAVWANSVQGPNGESRTIRSVTIQRRFFDSKDRTWKSADSFSAAEVAVLNRVLARAQQYLEDREEQIPI